MAFIESILPSGRGIRIEKIQTKDYRAANRRASERGATTAMGFGNDMALELLLSSLRAVTVAPVALVFVKDEKGEDTSVLDIDATLDAVPKTAWVPTSYKSLITSGETSLDAVLCDPADFEKAGAFVQRAVMAAGPLAMAVGNRVRTVEE